MSNAIGSRWERDLVNLLDEMGHGVLRIPASGSATTRDLPDVFAGIDGQAYAFEVKYSSGNPIYLDEAEILALRRFAKPFGADARIATRFAAQHGDPHYGSDISGWHIVRPAACHRTPGGRYRVKKDEAFDLGDPLEALAGVRK